MIPTVEQTDEQNRIRLDILKSLARSQRALAAILESIADVSSQSEPAALHLMEHLDAIGRHQSVLAYKILGIRLRRTYRSAPGKVWLHPRARIARVRLSADPLKGGKSNAQA